MLRDFSDKSRVQLISLVNEVENGKSSNFTDWIADRWVDFLSWIGQLNTKGSLNTVNNYHRKVIDKNNATKKAINQIFDHVNSIDKTYSNNLKDIENSLKQWETYIDSLGEIVSPANGTFNVQYITYKMSNVIKDMDEENVAFIRKYLTNETTVDRIYLTYLLEELAKKDIADMSDEELKLISDIILNPDMFNKAFVNCTGNTTASSVTTIESMREVLLNQLDVDSAVGKALSLKIKEHTDATVQTMNAMEGINDKYSNSLILSLISYIGTMGGITDPENRSGIDGISFLLNAAKASTKVEYKLFSYFLKTLHPKDAEKLNIKFGKPLGALNIAGDVAGLFSGFIDSYKIFSDPTKNGYDKTAQGIDVGKDIIDFIGDLYVTYITSDKAIRVVASGSGKVVNQILSTGTEIQYGISKAAAKKAGVIGTGLHIFNSGVATVSSAIKRYGEVSADGKIDMIDKGSIGVHASLGGLQEFSCGLIDGEKTATKLEKRVDEFVKGDSWAANYIKNKDNNTVARMAVSGGAGAVMAVEEIGDCVIEKAKVVAGWVATAGKFATNFISW